MELTDNKEKQQSLDLTEDSRETEWKFTSLVGEMFNGDFRWDLVHPFPLQSEEDKLIGDEFLARLEKCICECIDPDEVDRTGKISDDAMKALAELGCFGMKIPKKYGGLELSQTNYNRAIALVGSHCASTAVFLSAHQSIGVPQPLKLFGTKEQKEKYLPRLAKGAVSAFALTEVDVGSDPAQMKTTASPSSDGSYYTISGTKLWCTNGPVAEILIVMAQTPAKVIRGKERQQITAFIVESDSPGFEVVHRCRFMGLNGIANGLLRFNDVKVPTENIIGEPGKGLKIALVTLNTGRLTIPAASSACNKLCLYWSRIWSNDREQWGAKIGEHQAVADKLANIAADTFATESVTWLSSAFADQGNADIRLEAAIAKFFCTEISWQVVDEALQIRGGRGYERSDSLRDRGELPFPIERVMRDTRINRIIEGTSEIMRLFIAREAMDKHFRLLMPMLDPGKSIGEKVKMLFPIMIHYVQWYPKQWFSLPVGLNSQYLSHRNRSHLKFIKKTTKKLSRSLFHAMGIYQQRLEQEQLIMFRLVDIGTELFAMAATLAHAEALLKANNGTHTSQELADLFCSNAEKRIKKAFLEIKTKDGKAIRKVSNSVMTGQCQWLENGILTGGPNE